jgi:hypothetical protein
MSLSRASQPQGPLTLDISTDDIAMKKKIRIKDTIEELIFFV